MTSVIGGRTHEFQLVGQPSGLPGEDSRTVVLLPVRHAPATPETTMRTYLTRPCFGHIAIHKLKNRLLTRLRVEDTLHGRKIAMA